MWNRLLLKAGKLPVLVLGQFMLLSCSVDHHYWEVPVDSQLVDSGQVIEFPAEMKRTEGFSVLLVGDDLAPATKKRKVKLELVNQSSSVVDYQIFYKDRKLAQSVGADMGTPVFAGELDAGKSAVIFNGPLDQVLAWRCRFATAEQKRQDLDLAVRLVFPAAVQPAELDQIIAVQQGFVGKANYDKGKESFGRVVDSGFSAVVDDAFKIGKEESELDKLRNQKKSDRF